MLDEVELEWNVTSNSDVDFYFFVFYPFKGQITDSFSKHSH